MGLSCRACSCVPASVFFCSTPALLLAPHNPHLAPLQASPRREGLAPQDRARGRRPQSAGLTCVLQVRKAAARLRVAVYCGGTVGAARAPTVGRCFYSPSSVNLPVDGVAHAPKASQLIFRPSPSASALTPLSLRRSSVRTRCSTLDLPDYASEEILRRKLRQALSMGLQGILAV